MLQGCCHQIGCAKLANDVLVLHQLKSGLGCNLNAICSKGHMTCKLEAGVEKGRKENFSD